MKVITFYIFTINMVFLILYWTNFDFTYKDIYSATCVFVINFSAYVCGYISGSHGTVDKFRYYK